MMAKAVGDEKFIRENQTYAQTVDSAKIARLAEVRTEGVIFTSGATDDKHAAAKDQKAGEEVRPNRAEDSQSPEIHGREDAEIAKIPIE
jgi:hypothetical protein